MSLLENLFAPELKTTRMLIQARQESLEAALADLEEKEKSCAQKEENLLQKELDLEKRESDLNTLSEDIQKEFSKNIEYRRKLQDYAETLRLRKYEVSKMQDDLHKIEYNALIAINRWERKEWDYIQELQASLDKLSSYSSMVRRKNGFQFEVYVASLLKENGFTDVEVTKRSGDFGGDVFAVKNGLNYIFQCKYYAKPVGIHAVQEAIGAREPYHADRGVVVTNNVFSTAAIQLARANEIELWDCSDIARMNKTGEFF